MTFAPDGRLFICEQDGDLRVVKNGVLLAKPFVTTPTSANGERGLLGVAFHPNFPATPYVYVYYTTSAPNNRISRFTASGDTAATGSETVIVDLPTLSVATNHNGGAIHFGPDGKLYVAVGDNANGGNAQSTGTRLGKMLRYNDDGTIPADNPSIGTGVNQAIWAMGLRNPFTFGFQPGTGRVFINDVGQDSWEEINEGAAGANYGWPTTEGATTNPAFTSPLFSYAHSANPTLVVGFAIVGSAFYNPGTVLFPANYVGNYFFADYGNQWINRMDLSAGNSAIYAFARLPGSITDLAVGPDGALYALGVQGNGTWGVWRFSH
jgi:glucose/arabinose dehydrogenase